MSGAFVTGGNGFLGQALLKRLQLEPDMHPVRALARSRTNGEVVGGLGAEPVIGDVFDRAAMTAGMEGCDFVFHVAGVNQMCSSDPSEMYRVNVAGAVSVVEAAADAGVRRVVHTSSGATLGERKGEVGSESTEHRGEFLSHYERSKYQGEQAVFQASNDVGVEVVAVNPSSVQGPGRVTGSARLFLEYLNGSRRALVDTALSLIDIDDCAEGHVLAAIHGATGERYLLSGSTLSVREIVAMLDEITGLSTRPIFLPGWTASLGGAIGERLSKFSKKESTVCAELVRTLRHGARYDGARAERELGLQYSPLSYTLRRTVEWYVEFGFVQRDLPSFPRRAKGRGGSDR